jgi:hypothetical protein
MASKRIEQIVIKQGQPFYNRDAPVIATIIQEELEVSTDEVSEAQATGLVNITGMSYEMGMFAGLKIGEQNGQLLNRMLIFN